MSTSTYALAFYGFPIDSDEPWDLEERITEAGLGRKVRAVSFGPFDEYSTALAIHTPFVKVDAWGAPPCKALPDFDTAKQEKWDRTLWEAAQVLGLDAEHLKAHWFIAPWRI